MCLIVDVNVAQNVFLADSDENYKEIHECLFMGRNPPVKIVYGGQLTQEYSRNDALRRILLQLDRAGRTRIIADDLVDAERLIIEKLQVCQSNDQHIIALARAGKVRLLCSRDEALHADFKNKTLLDKPRGKVYMNSSHSNLLRTSCRHYGESKPASKRDR